VQDLGDILLDHKVLGDILQGLKVYKMLVVLGTWDPKNQVAWPLLLHITLLLLLPPKAAVVLGSRSLLDPLQPGNWMTEGPKVCVSIVMKNTLRDTSVLPRYTPLN